MPVLYFLIIMIVVVLVHELGHFFAARFLGITVVAFSIGFGREILGFSDRHGTRWRLGWILLGAYVKPLENVSEHTGVGPFKRRDNAQVAFSEKPVWKRIVVVGAGPAANVLLAVFVYAFLNIVVGAIPETVRIGSVGSNSPADRAGIKPGDVVLSINKRVVHSQDELTLIVGASDGRDLSFAIERGGVPLSIHFKPIVVEKQIDASARMRWADSGIRRSEPAEIGSVLAGLPAAKSGLQRGDIITAIQDEPLANYDDLVRLVAIHPLQALNFRVYRNGTSINVRITPERLVQRVFGGEPTTRGRIGVTCALSRLPPMEAIANALGETYDDIVQIFGSLRTIGAGSDPSVSVGGPIAMTRITGEIAELGTVPLIHWISILSLYIALINLFPLPVLDGGRLLLLGLEAVRGRPLDCSIERATYRVSLAFIWTLIAYANVCDLLALAHR